MTEIHDLFNFLLEKVFQKLPLQSRLICKEVCKRWNETLMTSAIFQKDRHIYLRNCIIKPNREPWTIFTKAKYPYHHLTICKGDPAIEMKSQLDMMCPSPVVAESANFWSHLGANVTEVVFRPGVSDRMFEILPFMPSVTTVTFGDYMIYCLYRSIAAKYEQRGDTKINLYNIKKVFIELLEFEDQVDFIDKIDMLLEHIPPSVELTIKKIACEYPAPKSYVFDSLELTNLPPHIGVALKKPDLEMTRLPSDCVGIKIGMQNESFDELKALVTEHPCIKELHLDINIHNKIHIPFEFPQVTELSINGIFDEQSFKIFEKMVNLKSLEVQTYDPPSNNDNTLHYFGHERVNLPKLEKLQYDVTFNCEDCMRALVASFPNLLHFENLKEEKVSLKSIKLRLTNWTNLQFISIASTRFQSFIDICNDIPEPRLHMRSITMATETTLTKHYPQDFEKLNKVFPNMHTLIFDFVQDLNELPAILKEIVEQCKYLVTLQIIGSPTVSVSATVEASVIETLAQHGQKIRVLNLPGAQLNPKEFEKKLRQCMPNLCSEEPIEEYSDSDDSDHMPPTGFLEIVFPSGGLRADVN